jgi:hypothetical protein
MAEADHEACITHMLCPELPRVAAAMAAVSFQGPHAAAILTFRPSLVASYMHYWRRLKLSKLYSRIIALS